MKIQKQRDLKGQELQSLGCKVDSSLHAVVKQVALDQGVSMSMIVEEAVRRYIEALGIRLEEETDTTTEGET